MPIRVSLLKRRRTKLSMNMIQARLAAGEPAWYGDRDNLQLSVCCIVFRSPFCHLEKLASTTPRYKRTTLMVCVAFEKARLATMPYFCSQVVLKYGNRIVSYDILLISRVSKQSFREIMVEIHSNWIRENHPRDIAPMRTPTIRLSSRDIVYALCFTYPDESPSRGMFSR